MVDVEYLEKNMPRGLAVHVSVQSGRVGSPPTIGDDGRQGPRPGGIMACSRGADSDKPHYVNTVLFPRMMI